MSRLRREFYEIGNGLRIRMPRGLGYKPFNGSPFGMHSTYSSGWYLRISLSPFTAGIIFLVL